MKRTRSKDPSPLHICPYAGCAKQFRSARLLQRHKSVHTAARPLSCPNPHCQTTFAYASQRDAHVREVHTIRQKTGKGAKHLLDGTDGVHVDHHTHENNGAIDIHLDDVSRDSQVLEEADEIVTNAAYLASQMKVARWQEADYLNAHQWARWVEESVEDFPDIPYLERKVGSIYTTLLIVLSNAMKIKEKALSMTALRQAERAFFDSVLAYEGFSEDILDYLLAAALTIDGKERDADDAEARVECLSTAITDAIERKNRLRIAADLAEQLQEVVGLKFRDETPAAKAEILLSRHKKLDMERVKEHVMGFDVRVEDVFEVVCHEAVIGHDANVDFRDVLFEACRRGIREGAGFGVGAELLAEVCERDVSFFDLYFAWLLGRFGWDGECTQVTQGKGENVDEVKDRIKRLAQRKGPIGYLTRRTVEDFSRRTGMRDLVTW